MNIRRWLLVALTCLAISGALIAYKYQQISDANAYAAALPEPSEAVELAIASAVTWQPSATVNAQVVAVQDVELSNELAGRIIELNLTPGQAVKRGQLLVKLDTREEEARLAAARSEANLAKLALDRNRRLTRSGATSEEARDQAVARRSSALAQVEVLLAIIDKKSLRAPFDAVAGLHQLTVGQYLEAGTVMTRLVGTSAGSWIDFSLPQHQANVQPGDQVQVRAPHLLDTAFEATIIARDAWVEVHSRHARYRAIPATETVGLLPGSIVTVTVPIGVERKATLVPGTALRRDAYGAHVFVLEPAEDGKGDRALRRAVIPGEQRGSNVIIRSGLDAGERLAGNGAFKLREGILVQAAPPPPRKETPSWN